MSRKQVKPTRPNSFDLVGLTPQYQEAEHGDYVDALIRATDREHELLRNIALSGTYGSGKSSILTEVADRKSRNVLTISLASLGADGDVQTPVIQKEILKQILYRVPPRRLPASRFRRPSKRSLARLFEDGLAVLVLIGLIAGAVLRISPLDDFEKLPLWKAKVPLLTLAAGLALLTMHAIGLFVTHRVRVGQLKAGPAILDLKDQSESYFDDWLDEIIYVFEVSRTKLVIFEDLDRFENAGILDDLRDLNSVLNSAQQITRRRWFRKQPRVQFIYAIRDSVFVDADEGVDSISAAADRAKFFDLIVPVSPFITPESADTHLWTVAQQLVPDIPDALVDIAAEAIVDMRLIKNVRNEFLMTRKIVLDGPTAIKSLSGEGLFAMIIYKNLHLADYEKIQRGESKLDELYRMSQLVATTVISEIDRDLARDRVQPRVEQRAREARDRLVTYANTTFRRLGAEASDRITFSLGDEEVDTAEFATPTFWTKLSSDSGTLLVEMEGHEESLHLSIDDLRGIVGRDISPNAWSTEATELSQDDRVELMARRSRISTGGMAALVADGGAHLMHGEADEQEDVSFADYCARKLDSPHALELLTQGFVNDDFPLYVSKYEDARVSKEAKRYLIQNVKRDLYSPYVPLKQKDVAAVLARQDSDDPIANSLLNIAIVDYILAQSPQFHQVLVSRLIDETDATTEFLTAYLANGTQVSALVALMAPSWAHGFDTLCASDSLPEPLRLELLGSFLTHADPSSDYTASSDTAAFLESALPHLEPFATGQPASIEPAIEVLEDIGVAAVSLAALSQTALPAFVAAARFKITGENLTLALPESVLSLDVIKAENGAVYQGVVNDLNAYADYASAQHGKLEPIRDRAKFAEVLSDIAPHSDGARRIIRLVPDNFAIERLDQVPSAVWPALLETGRAVCDIANCLRYFEHMGWDESLAEFMSRSAPTKVASLDVDPEVRRSFAHQVLATNNSLRGGASRRVTIARRARPETPLDLERIPIDSAPLIGGLLDAKLIQEGPELFRHLARANWDVTERAIAHTKTFADYVEPDLVTDRELALLFGSRRIPSALKAVYFERISTLARPNGNGTRSAVRWAVRTGRMVTPDAFRVLADMSGEKHALFLLLATSSVRWSVEEVDELTASLGAPYSHLAKSFRRPAVPNSPAVRAMLERMRGTWPIVNFNEAGDGRLRVSNKWSI